MEWIPIALAKADNITVIRKYADFSLVLHTRKLD